MLMMFAMTTDSVGVIIPEIIRQFRLSMTAAGAFQYATMGGSALAGAFLGFLTDRLGPKRTIIIGLAAFGADAYLLKAAPSTAFLVVRPPITGIWIGRIRRGASARP